MNKQVFLVAGPTGSGKDTIIREIIKRYPKVEYGVTAVTRQPRPNEVNGVNYYFLTNEKFEEEMAHGNIPEHYHRKSIDAYYGLYKPDLDERLKRGRIVAIQAQIIAAEYLKKNYNATTFFIMPSFGSEFEHRARTRAPMTDAEWQERLEFTKREIEKEAPLYDYQIRNEEGRVEDAVNQVVETLKKEGYVLE